MRPKGYTTYHPHTPHLKKILLFLHEVTSIRIKAENLFMRCLLLLTQGKLPPKPTQALYPSLQRQTRLGSYWSIVENILVF